MDQDYKLPDGKPEANFITLSLLGENPKYYHIPTSFQKKKSRGVHLYFFSAVLLRTYINVS